MPTPTFSCPYCKNPVACVLPMTTSAKVTAKCAACGGKLWLQLRVLKAGVPTARKEYLKALRALVGKDVRLVCEIRRYNYNVGDERFPIGTVLRCAAVNGTFVFLDDENGKRVLRCAGTKVEAVG